jgi:argininosuccinate lyase
VPLPIDRELVARALGTEGVDVNTIFAQNTRGGLESAVVYAMHRLSLTLSRFAADLIAMSSEALGFFALPTELTTGSSIMPQKRNPDALELVRATPSAMLARYSEITSLLQGLGSGYHRDLQRTKGPMVRALAEAGACVAVMQRATETIEVDADACARSLSDDIFATDRAFEHVRAGLPFRDAYRRVKDEGSKPIPIDEVLTGRDHLGAPGTDQGDILRVALTRVQSDFAPFAVGAQRARQLLFETPE